MQVLQSPIKRQQCGHAHVNAKVELPTFEIVDSDAAPSICNVTRASKRTSHFCAFSTVCLVYCRNIPCVAGRNALYVSVAI